AKLGPREEVAVHARRQHQGGQSRHWGRRRGHREGERPVQGHPEHKIMVPPNVQGKVKKQLPAGSYVIETAVLEVEDAGKTTNVTLFQRWPVREGRPVVDKLPGKEALLTYERVIDALFPVTLEAALRLSRARSAAARPSSPRPSPSTRTPTSWCMSAAASVATRWPRCSATSPS
ncbi:unnamed protein product, partial [Prorocentrum cordatum]